MHSHGAILPMYYAVLQNILFKIYFILYTLKDNYFISFEMRSLKYNINYYIIIYSTIYLTLQMSYKQCV